MKRIAVILLAVLLLACSACAKPGTADDAVPAGTDQPASPEQTVPEETPPPPPEQPEYEPLPDEELPPEQRFAGEWYADYYGLTISLTLGADGGYTLVTPGADTRTGNWEAKDGLLILDGKEDDPLMPLGSALHWEGANFVFGREKPVGYVPADVFGEAKEGVFDGYWKSHFTAMGDGTILSAAVGDDTELYIEGTKLATNGSLFGLAQYDCTVQNGAMTFATDKGTVTLQIQQDGFLRLSVSGGTAKTIYLMAARIPGATPNP